MKNLQKIGGAAALYMAAAYLVNIVLFIFVLDYPSIVNPAQKMALLIDKQMIMYVTNLTAYVIFGVVLVVLLLALYERLNGSSSAMIKTAAVIGFIWAGSLIASGMIVNTGMAPTVALYATDPAQASINWQLLETVADGLGGARGEVLGGLMTLLISWAAMRSKNLNRGINSLGLLIGVVGIISLIPALSSLASVFGMLQIVWFVWLGIILLRQKSDLVSVK